MAWAQFDKFKTVNVKRESRHALVVLARPNKSNALDDTMWTEIPQVGSDTCVRVSWAMLHIHTVYFQVFDALDKLDDVYAVGRLL